MYNRYIPRSDGTYQRKRIPDPPAPEPQKPPTVYIPPKEESHENCAPPPPQRQDHSPPSTGLDSFLRQLLPRSFDTGDLIVVLLLLLMAADCREEQNTALLTLALYLFL